MMQKVLVIYIVIVIGMCAAYLSGCSQPRQLDPIAQEVLPCSSDMECVELYGCGDPDTTEPYGYWC
jgi:hypothetical protein